MIFDRSWFAFASIVALGCSESADPTDSTGGSTPYQADGGSDSSGGGALPEGLSDGLTINEISPDDEWVELKNTGLAPLALDGLLVADRDGDTDSPKLDKAASLSGTLATGDYLLVVGDQDDVTSPVCPDGVANCVGASFKIGGTEGDAIFLVQGASAVARVDIEAGAVADGSTWGRVPDGTGEFALTLPTPSAPNEKAP